MAKNDFQYGGWNSYTLQCGTITTFISPGDCTLPHGMWLWNRDWIHQVAAPCNVIRGSWMTCHWIRPVVAPYSVTRSSGIMSHDTEFARWQHPAVWQVALGWQCHWIRPNVRHIGILHLVSISTTLPQSTSAPVTEILSKSDHPRQKKMTSCRFSRWRISAILDFQLMTYRQQAPCLCW